MVKGNDCGAKRGKLHSALSQSPGHPELKSFFVSTACMKREETLFWGLIGVVLAPWCAPTGLYLEDLAINQSQDWFVWISPAFFYFLFKQS